MISSIRNLASAFLDLEQSLTALGIAHGDLQHGNIKILNGKIKLIDYDGMFVPILSRRRASEIGHYNYQHPKRTLDTFDARMDRFSLISLYIAISALAERPMLWKKYSGGGQNVVFTKEDFFDPNNSPAIAEIREIPTVRELANSFKSICMGSYADIPTLSDFVARRITSIAVDHTRAAPRVGIPLISSNVRETLLAREGDIVQVVGKVTATRKLFSQRGRRPYAFVNFGDYRKKTFYIVLWNRMLALFEASGQDIKSLEGRYIAVTGMLSQYDDGPQIVIEDLNQIEVLRDEAEAQQRLSSGLQNPRRPANQSRSVEIFNSLYQDLPSGVPQSQSPNRSYANQNLPPKSLFIN